MLRRVEHAEHALMGAHIGQFIGHMVLHQIVLPRQSFQLGAFFSRRFGVKQGFQLRATGQLRAELAALGQKAALAAAERRTLRKAAGVFDLCVFPAGDFFSHAALQNIQKGRPRNNTRGRHKRS